MAKDKKKLARELIKLFERKKSERENWDSFWLDVARFFMPNKDDVFQFNNRSTGDRKHHRIFDATPVHFNELLANTLHSMMTNPSQIWFELNARDKKVNENPAVRKWLQELAEKMNQILNNTNFQAQVHEVYMDLGCFGTGIMGIFEDDDNILRFDSKPIYQFYIGEDSRGIVNSLCTLEKMTVEKAFDKFGEEAFGDEAHKLKSGDMNKKIDILQTIMPREKADQIGLDASSLPISSTHVWVEKGMIVRESGFSEFPYVVPRWMKLSDELYGRSPAMKALPDAKMLNAMMKTVIRGAQKIVDPPLLVPDDGVMGRINTTPGGINTYRAGTQDRIFPLETRANVGIGLEILKDVRERIKEHFFIDQFQLREGPQMTATEVNARVEMQLRLLGPLLGRLHFEFLQPMVARMLQIMTRKGQLPPNAPAELTQGEFELEVFFTSQIAKAQRSAEANNLVNFFNTLAPIVGFDPSAADVIDVDKAVRKIAILNGVPEDIFRDEDEIEELRAARAEAQAAKQQTETELAGAEILQKGVEPVQKLGLVGDG